jgi:hypothetical protein
MTERNNLQKLSFYRDHRPRELGLSPSIKFRSSPASSNPRVRSGCHFARAFGLSERRVDGNAVLVVVVLAQASSCSSNRWLNAPAMWSRTSESDHPRSCVIDTSW